MIRVVVAAALVDVHGLVLVQCRRNGGAHGGLWEFPGGKPEAGESLLDAVVRELAEELAIVVAPADLSPMAFSSVKLDDDDGTLVLLLYICRRWTGDPRPLSADALRWVGATALAALPMPPADVPLVATVAALLR